MGKAISAGDVVRTRWPLRRQNHLNLYLGSGRMGACFDVWGLMNNGRAGERTSLSNAVLMHADHWHRGAWGLDYWFPAARLCWAGQEPPTPQAWRQELRLAEGRMRTEMSWGDLRLSLSAWFHPERRDLLAVDVEYEATREDAMPALVLAPLTEAEPGYQQRLSGTARTVANDGQSWWLGRLKMGTADTAIALKVISTSGEAAFANGAEGMEIRFTGETGRHFLLIGIATGAREAELAADMKRVAVPEQYAAEAAQAWHRRWGEAQVWVPVPQYQALWARSLFWTFCSYAPEVRSPAPPCGWSGNVWGYHFPQDLSYIHPALLRLGHLDIARSWVEFYRGYLENMQEYTRRVYGAEGTMWAWEFPIGPDSELLREGAPNQFQYEIHNAAYPARMAREAARYLGDAEWSREVAWPIVRESARFFSSILRQEEDGTWGEHVIPSSGQDEMGGPDQKNYLDALFSAQYSLQTALQMAGELNLTLPSEEVGRWETILRDGLAYGRLYDQGTGLLATCEGLAGAQQMGKEKHPVQLNPLIFLPLSSRYDGRLARRDRGEQGGEGDGRDARRTGMVDEYVRRAYERRYDLCAGVREHTYYGWTLAAYWLAASHLGDAAGLAAELGQCRPGRYVDREWIQINETSGYPQSAYYVTSHGLYLQALTDALVSDYWGETEIGAACPQEWEEVGFSALRTADGKVWTGEKVEGVWAMEEE
jgi:hypothetical protein